MLRKRWSAAVVAALALVAGCHNSGHNQNSTDMRALNAVVDAEPLDFLVADDVKAAALPLGATSSYSEFTAGTRDVKVRSSTVQSILAEKSTVFGDGLSTTLVAYGKRATMSLLTIADDNTAPGSGFFGIRAAGLSADAASTDLYLATGDISSVAPTISALAYGGLTDFAQITPGSYSIVLTTSGTKDILFQSAPQSFKEGQQPLVAVIPAGGGKLVNVVLMTPPGDSTATLLTNPFARVKAVNAIADAPSLNFKADAATLFSNVTYTGISSYATTAAGTRTLRAEAAAVPGVAIASLTRALDPAKDYTLVALNRLAQAQLVAFADDNSLPATGFARVRFANTLVDSTTVDVLVNFATQTQGIPYAGTSGYYQLAPTTPQTLYTVSFTAPGGAVAIATSTSVEVDAGSVYTFYLMGTSAAPQIKIIRDR
jgi:outer membrane murein-binding lipoprotein Lpp